MIKKNNLSRMLAAVVLLWCAGCDQTTSSVREGSIWGPNQHGGIEEDDVLMQDSEGHFYFYNADR